MTAISILFHLTQASDDKNYFRDLVRQNFQIVIVIEFIANIHSFSIGIEMIILPIIVGLSILSAIAEVNEIPSIGKLTKTVLGIYILILLIFSIIDIVNSVRDYSNFDTIRSFVFPIILTISFIPSAYFIALLMEYESLFASTRMFFKDKSRLHYIKIRALLTFGFNIYKLNRYRQIIIREFHTQSTKSDIKEVLSGWKYDHSRDNTL